MSSARNLYSLQELDLSLERIEAQRTAAELELAAGMSLDGPEAEAQAQRERLQEVNSQYRLQRLDADTLRERLAQLNSRLYGADVTNPRELPGLADEVSNVEGQLKQQDDHLLGLSAQAEELQKQCASLEQKLSEARAAWESRQSQLREQVARLAAELDTLSAQRLPLAALVDPSEVKRYESLRRTKGGRAVAKVERGLCQACRMSLPTQQLQRVRSGRQTVLCNSCGRILFVN